MFKNNRWMTLIAMLALISISLLVVVGMGGSTASETDAGSLPTLAILPGETAIVPSTGVPVAFAQSTSDKPPTDLPLAPTSIPPASKTPKTSSANIANPSATSAPTTEPITINVPAEPVMGQVVIRFQPDASQQEREAYIASISGRINQEIDALDTVVVNVPQQIAAQSLPDAPVIVASEPDYFASAQVGPEVNDPLFPDQWGLPVIGVPEAWPEIPSDAPLVTVAVIDSGICVDHPDLQGRILSGWDFIENDNAPQDEFDHGCGVAGIIAATADNGIGIAGIAPNAMIMPLRVLNGQGIGTYSNVAAAIVYAVDNGAKIINLSLGGAASSSVLQDAVDYAIARDVVVIAAAGNTGGNILYPAAYESVIAVGSVDVDLQLSNFSARGVGIGLLAPGRDITTTTINGSYRTMSGTSFAGPHVAGMAVIEMVLGREVIETGLIVIAGGSVILPESPTEIIPDVYLPEEMVIALINKPTNFIISPPWTSGRSVTITRSYHDTSADAPQTHFGQDKYALDFMIEQGQGGQPGHERDVRAVAPGTIVWKGVYTGGVTGSSICYGNTVAIEHNVGGEQFVSFYAHLRSLNPTIAIGSSVALGALLGEVGNTGSGESYENGVCASFGSHLHFVIYKDANTGTLQDPHPPFAATAVRPEPFVGEEVYEGFGLVFGQQKGWKGPLSGASLPNDAVPGSPGGSWGNSATTNNSQINPGEGILFSVDNLPSDVKEIRFTAFYENWSLMDDEKDRETWRILARCRPNVIKDNCTWNSSNTMLQFSWDPYDPTFLVSDAPWLPSGSGFVNQPYSSSQQVPVCISFDVFDQSGNVTYAPMGVQCSTVLPNSQSSLDVDQEPVESQGNGNTGRVIYIQPFDSGDTILPTVAWTTPSNGDVIVSNQITLGADASDNAGGSGVREVRFSALWGGVWHGIGYATTAPYTINWDWCVSDVPDGDLELGLEVWDDANNKWVYSQHYPNIHVTKAFTCPSTVVSNLDDSGVGSLRQAVINADDGATITFDTYGTITIESTIVIDKNLTIIGPGAQNLIIQAQSSMLAFNVSTPGINVDISGLQIQNADRGAISNRGNLTLTEVMLLNNGGNDGTNGGAVSNIGGSLTVIRSTLANNEARRRSVGTGYRDGEGGGIFNDGGTVVLINSTLSGNRARQGGSLYTTGNSRVEISHSTLADHSASIAGRDGIYSVNSDVLIKNSIVAGGDDSNCGVNGGTFTALGENLSSDTSCPNFTIVNTNPLYNPLQSYGGLTFTRTLAGQPHQSAAIDVATDCTDINGELINSDQRGYPRPQGTTCDLGPVEYNSLTDAPHTRIVTNLNDSGAGSLRQAVVDALQSDTIQIIATGVLPLESTIVIDKNLTIIGPGAQNLIIQAQSSMLAFNVSTPGINVDISGLQIQNADRGAISNRGNLTLTEVMLMNNGGSDGTNGGAVSNIGGNLTVIRSTLADNEARRRSATIDPRGEGGGIFNDGGTVVLINSTLSGNRARQGGSLYTTGNGRVEISHTTLADHSASIAGRDGIYSVNSDVLIKNSIVAGGDDSNCGVNGGTFTALGENLSSDTSCPNFTITQIDPLLDDIGDNGGPTLTRALLSNSPAIDSGSDCLSINNALIAGDQRGISRPQGTNCDLGAYEYISVTPATINGEVTLQGRGTPPSEQWRIPLRVEIIPEGGSTPVFDQLIQTDEYGHFVVTGITTGVYRVRVQNDQSLRNAQTVTLQGGDNTVDMGLLRVGDLDQDGIIDLTDYSILSRSFLQFPGDADYNPHTDLSGDEITDLTDYSILVSNFFQTSSQSVINAMGVGTVDLRILPELSQIEPGQEFNIQIEADVDNMPVVGVQALINFDPSRLEVVSITATNTLPQQLINTYDNAIGQINFAVGALSEPFPTTTFTIATIRMRALNGAMSTSLQFSTTLPRQTKVVDQNGSILGGLENASITISSSDITPPVGVMSDPLLDSYQTGPMVTLGVDISDDGGTDVDYVQYLLWVGSDNGVDGWENICLADTTPFDCDWDVSGRNDGEVLITARATDYAGNTNYYMQWDGEVWHSFWIDQTPPMSSVDTLPSILTTPTFIISWGGSDATSGVSFYDVQYQDNGGPWLDWQITTTATSAEFEGQTGHRYGFRSRAYDLAGNIEAWSESADTQTTIPLVSPSNAAPERNSYSTTTPTLYWGDVSWATGYEIQVDDDASFSSPEFVRNNLLANETFATTDPLIPATYYWRVRARQSNGSWGGWSEIDSFVIAP